MKAVSEDVSCCRMRWQIILAKDKLFLAFFMALKGKCSIDQVDGQTSAPIESATFTQWRKSKPLRVWVFFFFWKYFKGHAYICKGFRTDFSNPVKKYRLRIY